MKMRVKATVSQREVAPDEQCAVTLAVPVDSAINGMVFHTSLTEAPNVGDDVWIVIDDQQLLALEVAHIFAPQENISHGYRLPNVQLATQSIFSFAEPVSDEDEQEAHIGD